MAKVDAGAAVIALEAQDKTAPAFRAASENIEQYKAQVRSLDDNLKPLQDLLKGGMAAGGATAGIGAMLGAGGNVGGALENLKNTFLGIRDAAEEAGQASFFTEAADALTDIGAGVTSVFAGLAAGLEVTKSVGQAWRAAVTITQEFQTAMTALKETKAAATVIEGANAAATTAAATASTVDTAAKIADTAATAAAATGAGIFAAAQTAAAVATNFLTVSLGLNPLTAWLVVITATVAAVLACVAAIARLAMCFFDQATAAEKAVEATRRAREENEALRKESEMYTDRLETLNEKEHLSAADKEETAEIVKMLNSRYEGLGLQIDETTGKVVDADGAFVDLRETMAEIADGDLTAEIDALGGRLDELHGRLKDGQISWLRWAGTWLTLGYVDNASEIKAQIAEVEKALDEAEEKRVKNRQERDRAQIQREREQRREREAAAREAEQQEQQQRREQEAAEKQAAEQAAQAAKAREAANRKMADFAAGMEKEIRAETQTALEKELEALEEKIALQRQYIEEQAAANTISEEERKAQLDYLERLKAERAEQIKHRAAEQEAERRKAAAEEARRYSEQFEEGVRERNRREATAKEDAEITARIKQDPVTMAAEIAARVKETGDLQQNAEAAVRAAIEAASADGEITAEEREEIERLKKQYDEATAEAERMRQHAEAAQAEIENRIDGMAADQSSEKAAPLDTLAAGSVEAYKKEIELKGQGQEASPEKKSIDEMRQQLAKEAAAQKKRDEERAELMRELVENVGGV